MKRKILFICLLFMIAGTSFGCATQNDNDTQISQSSGKTQTNQNMENELLYFSKQSGFYDNEIELEIMCKVDDAVIYYTTDGSEPDESDERYEGPITLKNKSFEPNVLSAKDGICASGDFKPSETVEKANVIRAAAFYPDGTHSKIISGTYFVGIDHAKFGAVPVISLFTDQENLFNYETGIYILGKTYKEWLAEDKNNKNLPVWVHVGNYSNRGREWERPVTVEYFAADGSSAFVQDMGIRIMGGASRDSVQKSFRITAREEYGNKSVKYELIPNNLRADGNGTVEKYKSFVLRNGGNDRDSTKIRDPFMQELVSDRRFETEQYTPCVVYLDGEYWGVYTLNEDYNDHYIENNYGIDNNNVIVLKRGEIEDGNEEDIELYNEMYDFITENDMSVDANYAKAAEMLDMGSFIDFCAVQLYTFNEDSIFENNNWEMWRVRDVDRQTEYSDGKWRMMMYDMDYTCGVYAGGSTFKTNNIEEVLQGKRQPSVLGDEQTRPANQMFLALYHNSTFKQELVLAMCDLRNINFEKVSATKKMKQISAVYSKIVPNSFRRFGPSWVVMDPERYYSQKVEEIASFLDGRYVFFPQLMQSAMELGDKVKCSLSVSDGTVGSVKINSSGIPITDVFTGSYFTDYDITLTAIPTDGAKFVCWEYENCTVSNEKEECITVSFQGDFSIRAIFE